MPIAINYQPPYAVQADASLAGAGGVAQENMRRWQAEFGEGQRQFDLNYDYRLNMAALEDDLRRRQLSQQYDIALGGQQLEAGRLAAFQQNAALDYDLGQQQIDQRDRIAELDASRLLTAKQMDIAQRFAAQNMEQAMAAEKAAREVWRTLTPQQQQQIMQQHEERFGIPWGGPERAMMQQQEQEAQTERQRWLDMLQAPDGSGMMAGEAYADMLMRMDPEKAMNVVGKLQSEWRQRESLELDKANMARDDDRAIQENANAQIKADQDRLQRDIKFAQEQYFKAEKAKQDAEIAKWKAQWSAWSKAKELGETVGEEPKLNLPGLGQLHVIGTQEEYDALPSGSEYISSKTGRKARKP